MNVPHDKESIVVIQKSNKFSNSLLKYKFTTSEVL